MSQTEVLTISNPEGLYDPSPFYSQLAVVEGGARLIFVAGQAGEYPDGTRSTDFKAQVVQTFKNIETALAAAGATIANVAKMTILIVDHSPERLTHYIEEFNRVWGDHPKPACTVIPVPMLALEEMLFEIEVTAVLPDEE